MTATAFTRIWGSGDARLLSPADWTGVVCRQVLRQTILNESLAVLIANILNVDIAHALDEIPHRLCPVRKSSGSNLPFRAYETGTENGGAPWAADHESPDLSEIVKTNTPHTGFGAIRSELQSHSD